MVEYLIYKISILKKAFLIVLAVFCAGLFFSKGFSFGIFVGGIISMANFSLLAKYIARMKEFALNKAKRFIITKFLIMYFVMAAALFIGITKGVPVFAGVAGGLLAVKFAIFLDNFLVKNAGTI